MTTQELIRAGTKVRIDEVDCEGTVWGYARAQSPAVALVWVELVDGSVDIVDVPVENLTEIG